MATKQRTTPLTGSFNMLTSSTNRRLARRGGVKRISGQIYEDVRGSIRDRLKLVRLLLHITVVACTDSPVVRSSKIA